MSLLQKASIITTPTAYAEDYLYSIKPAQSLGQELVTNGTFDTDSDWTFTGSGVNISNGKLNFTGTTREAEQSISLISNRKYRVSFEVLDYSSGDVRVELGSGLGTVRNSNGVYVEDIEFTGTPKIQIDATSFFTGSIDNVSVKEITDADFDFDRNSTGTRVNEDYLIEDVPYNFISYSEDFSNSGWTKENITILSNNIISPDGTLNGDKISETATNTYHALSESINISSGNYTISVFAKLDERQYILIRSNLSGSNVNTTFDLSNGLVTYNGHTSASIESAGNGWYRCSVTSNSSVTSVNTAFLPSGIDITNNNLPTYLGVVGNGLYIYGAQIVKGDQPKDYLKTTDRLDIPRIDYTNGEPSILLETQRQNLVTYSQDFTQWSKTGTTSVSSNDNISPEGIQNASTISGLTGSGGNDLILNTGINPASKTYSFSVYLKGTGTLRLHLSNNVDNAASEIVTLTSSWVRYELIHTFNSTSASLSALLDDNGATATEYNIYGAQLEEGSYPTSLIHTSGSAVTRSADVATNAGNSDLINSTEGVLYVEMKKDKGNQYSLISLQKSGITNTYAYIGFLNNNTQIKTEVKVSGVNVFNSTQNFTDTNQYFKIALKFKSGDYALWINGEEKATGTSTTIFSNDTLNQLEFGNHSNSIFRFFGNAKSIMVFKEALTDLELEKLTGYNNHELYMNYYNRLSYLGLAEEYNVESDINNYIL